MALSTSAAQISSAAGALPAGELATITVRLYRSYFLLWKTQVIPNLTGAGRLSFIDGSSPGPPKTVITGTGAEARTIVNPDYTALERTDQRVLSVLLGSMTEEILAQMIGRTTQMISRTTSATVWSFLTSMFSGLGRASTRAYRRKLATTQRQDMKVADYFHLMKGFADAMATVGAPVPDDELIDYILAGLGSALAPLQASLNVFSNTNPNAVIHLSDFYAMLVSHEAMQDTSSHEINYSSSANSAI